MLKKGITSLLALSLIGISGTAAFAAQPNSVQQNQGSSQPYHLLQLKTNNVNVSKNQIGPAKGSAGNVTSAGALADSTNGPATLNQSHQSSLNLKDQEKIGGKTLTQSTHIDNTANQSADVTNPTQVVLGTVTRSAAVQDQVSIPGGPTIQHQQAQRTALQANIAAAKVSPGSGPAIE